MSENVAEGKESEVPAGRRASGLQGLADYVRLCLPEPRLTEATYWTFTSMPDNGRSPQWHQYTVLSIHNEEIVFLGVPKGGGMVTQRVGFLHIAADSDVSAISPMKRYKSSLPSFGEVWTFDLMHPGDLSDLLSIPEIAAGGRKLAKTLMREGTSRFARFHDHKLANAVFALIEAEAAAGAAG